MKIKTFNQAYKLAKELFKQKDKINEVLNNATNKQTENKDRLNQGLLHDLKMLKAMLKDYLSGKYKFSSRTIIYIVAGLLYFISPVDLIPDFLLGFGFVDDAAVLAMVIKRIKTELDKYKELNTFDEVEVIDE